MFLWSISYIEDECSCSAYITALVVFFLEIIIIIMTENYIFRDAGSVDSFPLLHQMFVYLF